MKLTEEASKDDGQEQSKSELRGVLDGNFFGTNSYVQSSTRGQSFFSANATQLPLPLSP